MRSVREYIEIEGVEYISWPLYGVRSWAGVDPAGRKDRVLLTAWKESGERRIKLVGFGRWDRRWRFAGVSLRRVAINFLLRVWNTWWIREMDFDSWVRSNPRLDEEVVFYLVVCCTFSLLSSREFVSIYSTIRYYWKCTYVFRSRRF